MFDFRLTDTAGYSNTNYLLLSMIVESVTGMPHTVTMHEDNLPRFLLMIPTISGTIRFLRVE